MLVQAGLCRICSETTLLVFPRGGSNAENMHLLFLTKPSTNRTVQSQMAICLKFRIYEVEGSYYLAVKEETDEYDLHDKFLRMPKAGFSPDGAHMLSYKCENPV